MKIYLDWPPNIEAIDAAFQVRAVRGVIFAWGPVIYNPHHVEITPELMAHEGVHASRQGKSDEEIRAWWARYLAEPEFRFAEELPAHRAEYRRYCERHKDRNARSVFLRSIAARLASPLYGSLVTEIEARQRIAA